MKLPLKKIRCDGGTQPRTTLYDKVIEEYAEAMREGAAFPPLIVFHDGKNYWLADGFHRLGAAMNLELDTIECDVRQGTLTDAQWFSFSVNQSHGMRRTNDDKARAVKSALRHCKGERSDREIARHVGVGHDMVANHRQALIESGDLPSAAHLAESARCAKGESNDRPSTAHLADSARCAKGEDKNAAEQGQPARVVTRKGKTYQMKVGQIGKAQKPNRKKFGGIAKNAYPATKPVALPSEMLSISLPIDNPHMAAKGMLSRYERTFLVALVNELSTLLKEGN